MRKWFSVADDVVDWTVVVVAVECESVLYCPIIVYYCCGDP